MFFPNITVVIYSTITSRAVVFFSPKAVVTFLLKPSGFSHSKGYCALCMYNDIIYISSSRQSLFWSEISYNKPPPRLPGLAYLIAQSRKKSWDHEFKKSWTMNFKKSWDIDFQKFMDHEFPKIVGH